MLSTSVTECSLLPAPSSPVHLSLVISLAHVHSIVAAPIAVWSKIPILVREPRTGLGRCESTDYDDLAVCADLGCCNWMWQVEKKGSQPGSFEELTAVKAYAVSQRRSDAALALYAGRVVLECCLRLRLRLMASSARYRLTLSGSACFG